MLRISVFGSLLFLVGTSLFAQNQSFMGALVRGDIHDKSLALVFTGHEYADGGEVIMETLKNQNVKAGFFLTGDFYRKFPVLSKSLAKHNHYLGAHSDKHLLYCSWKNRDSLLVKREKFIQDLKDNYAAMANLGIAKAKYFLPPYEWYNQRIADWSKEEDVQLINFTHGTLSHADYTTPEMKNYRSSDTILESIYKHEEEKGLNGFILLVHIGTDPARTDKLYNRLPELIQTLRKRGYTFKRVDELLE